jgi:glutamate-1-semialdehyde 2,1-aminomutase
MLRKLESASPYAALEQRTLELKRRLEDCARKAGMNDLSVQSHGSLFWIVSGTVATDDGIARAVEHIPATQGPRFTRLFHALLDRGIYLAPSGFEVGFLSAAHTEADLERIVAAFAAALPALN